MFDHALKIKKIKGQRYNKYRICSLKGNFILQTKGKTDSWLLFSQRLLFFPPYSVFSFFYFCCFISLNCIFLRLVFFLFFLYVSVCENTKNKEEKHNIWIERKTVKRTIVNRRTQISRHQFVSSGMLRGLLDTFFGTLMNFLSRWTC